MKSKRITKSPKVIDNNDIFDSLSAEWWDINGSFSALHEYNFIRIKFIQSILKKKSLDGVNFLDVGCGGGILCEPLARLGGSVTGIDSNKKAIDVAIEHARRYELDINYKNCDLADLNCTEKFDVITCMEVLEHQENLDSIIKFLGKNLKKNGYFIGSTINRSISSYFLAIFIAERVLGLVPQKTHNWNNFIKPNFLKKKLLLNGFSNIDFQGTIYNPVTKRWLMINTCDVNYMFKAQLK